MEPEIAVGDTAGAKPVATQGCLMVLIQVSWVRVLGLTKIFQNIPFLKNILYKVSYR